MRPDIVSLVVLVTYWSVLITGSKTKLCGPGFKRSGKDCVSLTNKDVLFALNFLAFPPNVTSGGTNTKIYLPSLCEVNWIVVGCKTTITTVQGISLCEDFLIGKTLKQEKNKKVYSPVCNIVSVIATTRCDHFGSLAFEKYWSERGCVVTFHHFTLSFKGNVC